MSRPSKPKPQAKPTISTPTRAPIRVAAETTTRCRVPICRDVNCNLRTHQLYGHTARDTSSIERPVQSDLQAVRLEDDMEKHLFRHFMDTVVRKKFFVYGPAYPAVYNMSELRTHLFHRATVYGHDRLIILSVAFCDVFLELAVPNDRLQMFHQRTKTAMRQVDGEIDSVLMFLIVQSVLDHHLGHDVGPHRRLLQQIAEHRVHTLDKSLHYVVEADRRLAVWTKSPSVLQIMTSDMSGFEYVKEARDLVKLYECENRHFDTDDIQPVSPYCYYKRDELANAFTKIHATREGIDWCAAVAARIIEYQITFEGEIVSFLRLTVDFLLKSLKDKVAEVDWKNHKQLLAWILFVLEDSWAIRRIMDDIYGPIIPNDWATQQWTVIRQEYLWAESMRPAFDKVCASVTTCIVRPGIVG